MLLYRILWSLRAPRSRHRQNVHQATLVANAARPVRRPSWSRAATSNPVVPVGASCATSTKCRPGEIGHDSRKPCEKTVLADEGSKPDAEPNTHRAATSNLVLPVGASSRRRELSDG